MDPLRSYANLNKAFAIAKQTNSFKRNDETVKMDKNHFPPGDPVLIQNIVNNLKARGIFDQFRHECLADVDTKPSYQNLSQRVDGFVSKFLANETWNPDQNKNELRNKLRRHIDESGMLSLGVDHVVEQVINPKIYQVFAPKIREVVEQYLGLREMPDENESKTKKQESIVPETGIKTEKQVSDNSDCINTTAKSIVSDPISEILALSDSSKQKKVATSAKVLSDEKPKISLEMISESLNQTMESLSSFDSKSQIESLKIKKEPRLNEGDTSSDLTKKSSKTMDLKSETRSSFDDIKLLDQDISFSEDSNSYSGTNKSSDATDFKSDSSIKSKSSGSMKAKIKSSSTPKECLPKIAHTSTESRKFKFKDYSEAASPSKSPVDKLSKLSLKVPKVPSKDHYTPTKSLSSSSKSSKEEIEHKLSSATKVLETYRNLFSSKTFSVKREVDVSKSKNVDDKGENKVISEQKIYHGDVSHPKSKINSPVSSSYESSQGSDQEKDPLIIAPSKERRKLFSKGSKPENEPRAVKDMDKSSSSSTPIKTDKSGKKDHLEKHADRSQKALYEKHMKSMKVQESSKIVSRSDSTKSSSSIGSTSDSSKETSYHSTGSEGMEDSSSSKSDLKKKKSPVSQKKSCKDTSDEPSSPPPPPPPSSSQPIEPCSSSFESESLESDDQESSDEGNSDNSPSAGDSDDSSSNLPSEESKCLNQSGKQNNKNDEKLLSDVPDVFLESSSEDEFCYFSTPEKATRQEVCDSDVTVSSVHTSDLSSFEDEQSDSSGDENSAKSNFEENFPEKLKYNDVENVSPLNLKKRRRNGEKVNSYLQRRAYEL